MSNSPSPLDTAISAGSCHCWCLQAHRQSPRPRHLRKRTRSQGPFLSQHYPASTVIRPRPTPAMAVAFRDVEAATLALDGSPPITRTTFRRAVPTTPADRAGAYVDCFPAHAAFPKWPEGRHPHCHFRGLLRLHTCYGPPDRSAAQGDLCHEAPALPVTRPNRSSATRSIDNSLGGTFLHW